VSATQPRPGDFYLCKYRGSGNGDLIAGRVLFVEDGQATLENLLTGKSSRKSVAGSLKRNWRAPRSCADLVVARFRKAGKGAARELAVEMYQDGLASPPMEAAAQ
jgi:hypothetical protein